MDACRDAVNLEHELRDAVPSADLEGTVGVIEQDHADVPAVVRVDDARAHVDVCFQARPLRGAMRPYIPRGRTTAMSVRTSAFPCAGTTVSCAA